MTSTERPLTSRVLGINHLETFKKEVMEESLVHHLKLAGMNKNILSEEAVFTIHQCSGGILRKANNVAITAKLAVDMEDNQQISAEHVRIAATELIL